MANDITARGHHQRDSVPADAFRYDWFAAKSMDGALPLGPGITPAFQVPDPQHLRLRLWVNGELQQDESTADMVCTVAELIAAASEVATLEAGDVIATGTPSGVGAGRGLYLRPGDVVRTSIDGLGDAGKHRGQSIGRNVMIFVTHDLPVNVPGEPALGRSDVWDGLVLKANNALPFVPSMTFCEVTSRLSDTVFDRDIEFRGEHFTERITMEEPHRVTFTRIAGPGARHDRQRDRGPATTTCGCGSASPWSWPGSRAAPPRSRSTPTP